MTNKMIEQTMTIRDNVNTLSQYNKETSEESLNQLVDSIIHKSQSITKLLSQMITATEQEMKEEKGGEA
jgi:methyl-accepting chemotaxis protein